MGSVGFTMGSFRKWVGNGETNWILTGEKNNLTTKKSQPTWKNHWNHPHFKRQPRAETNLALADGVTRVTGPCARGVLRGCRTSVSLAPNARAQDHPPESCGWSVRDWRKTSETSQTKSMYTGWWLSHLPLVGNILLILMVNING